jgi:hypothetical protein
MSSLNLRVEGRWRRREEEIGNQINVAHLACWRQLYDTCSLLLVKKTHNKDCYFISEQG